MNAYLCIHGFTESPMEIKLIAEYIQAFTNWKCTYFTLSWRYPLFSGYHLPGVVILR